MHQETPPFFIPLVWEFRILGPGSRAPSCSYWSLVEMLGSSVQLGRGHGEDRVCYADKARWSRHSHQRHYQQSPWRSSSTSAAGTYPAPSFASGCSAEAVVSVSGTREQENRAGTEEDTPKTGIASVSSWGPSVAHSCNLKRFLESVTPSVPALYPSKV